MKLIIILLTVAAMQVSAKGHSQGITLSLKDVSLKTAFVQIRNQAPNFDFFYDESWLKDAKKVSIEVKNASLNEVLEQCFKDQPFTFSIAGSIITVHPKNKPTSPADNNISPLPITIKGIIVNEAEEPVEGASIKVKNTDKGTKTNEKGEFMLEDVDEKAVLEISHVTYETLELPIKNQTGIRITLKAKIGNLDVITVNNGYQLQKTNEVIGSVFVITKEQLNQRVATNIIDKLEGISNGLVFNKDAGTGKNKLRIRGESTIFGVTEPLIIVDNFPYPNENINDINPNDVESVTILKDAAAASIWGARAGNGVIVITTKSGKINQPLRLELTANTSITSKPDLFYTPLIKPSDFIDFEIMLFNKGKYNSDLTNIMQPVLSPVVEILNDRKQGIISSSDSAAKIDGLRAIDWRNDMGKYMYQNAIAQQYQMSLNGGSNKVSYYFSAGYDKGTSSLVGDNSERLTLSNKTSYRPVKKMEVQIGLIYDEDKTITSAISQNVSGLYPYMNLIDGNGNELSIPQHRTIWEDTILSHGFLDYKYYPFEERNLQKNIGRTFATRLSTQIQYSIFRGLRASISYQYYRSISKSKFLIDEQSYFIRNNVNTYAIISNGKFVGTNYPTGGQLSLFNSDQIGHNGRFQLDYNHNWKVHTLSAIAGFEVRQTMAETNGAKYYGYDDATGTFALPNLTALYPTYVGTNQVGSAKIGDLGLKYSGGSLNRFRSFYANSSYTFKNRYYLFASGRLDQANIFGVKTNQKGTPLWSVGTKWDIGKESLYKIKFLPDLSLRITYGYQGNVSPTAVAITTLRYSGNADYTGLPFSVIDNFPNPKLRWEKSGQLNIGIGFASKNNILSGTIDYFKKNGKDLLGVSSIDPTAGISTLMGNFSDMESKGVDVMLSTKNIDKGIKWFSTFILNYATEEVTRYDIPYAASSLKDAYFAATPLVGYPLYSLFSFRWGGLNPTTGDPRIYLGDTLNQNYNTQATLIKMSDLIYSGRYNPPISGSFSNNITWKGISLSFNVGFKFGHYFRRKSISYSSFVGDWQSGHKDFSSRWQKPGDELLTDVPSFIYPISNGVRDDYYTKSDVLVEKADHIRLQFINLGYDFNQPLLYKLKIQSLSIHFYANNLGIIWRANKYGIDPDYPYLSAPPPPVFSFGINVGF